VKNNQTVQTYLDLGACFGSFAVQAPGAMSRQAERGIFEQRCEDIRKGRHLAIDCDVTHVVAIKPGETYNLQWDGLVSEEIPLVNECYEPARPSEPSSSPSSTCWSSRAPEAGTLQGVIKLYRFAYCQIYLGCSQEMAPYTVVSPSFNYPGDTQVQVEVN
jgi:hypothetical protein